MALAGVEYAGSLFFSFVCGTWDRTGNARDILFLCDTLIVLLGEFLARKIPFTVIGCEWNTCACLLSTVLHSGQWLNKPRRKAEKGRGKLTGGRGGVHWKCIAKWKQSRKDIARKRTACVDNDKKKKKNYLLQKTKEAKEILTAKSKEGKTLSRNCRAIVMVCMWE